MNLWYVVELATGVRFEPGHDTEAAAMLGLTDKTATYDGCVAGRFDIVCEPASPWAYATPAQAGRQ